MNQWNWNLRMLAYWKHQQNRQTTSLSIKKWKEREGENKCNKLEITRGDGKPWNRRNFERSSEVTSHNFTENWKITLTQRTILLPTILKSKRLTQFYLVIKPCFNCESLMLLFHLKWLLLLLKTYITNR